MTDFIYIYQTLQEKIVAGNRIIITLSSETMADCSLTQNDDVVSLSEASTATILSKSADHYGTGRSFLYISIVFLV